MLFGHDWDVYVAELDAARARYRRLSAGGMGGRAAHFQLLWDAEHAQARYERAVMAWADRVLACRYQNSTCTPTTCLPRKASDCQGESCPGADQGSR